MKNQIKIPQKNFKPGEKFQRKNRKKNSWKFVRIQKSPCFYDFLGLKINPEFFKNFFGLKKNPEFFNLHFFRFEKIQNFFSIFLGLKKSQNFFYKFFRAWKKSRNFFTIFLGLEKNPEFFFFLQFFLCRIFLQKLHSVIFKLYLQILTIYHEC